MTTLNLILSYDSAVPKNPHWPIAACSAFFVAALFLQFVFLPCLCGDNGPKLEFAATLDILYVARLIAARYFHESRGWLFYSLFLVSSAFWIEPLLNSPSVHALYAPFGIHPFQ